MPWLSSLKNLNAESPLFKSWTERLLVQLCKLSDQSTERGDYVEPADALQTYRFWAKYWESAGKAAAADGMALHRRSAWKAYYDTLSVFLREKSIYGLDATSYDASSEKPAIQPPAHVRLQQRAELKRVETTYESILLKETYFPKASENNHEIEAWADAVIENWRVLCGPSWSDDDLGEGGKEGVGRGVLDVRLFCMSVRLSIENLESDYGCVDSLSRSNKDISLYTDPTTLIHCPCFPCRFRPRIQSLRLLCRDHHARQGSRRENW